MTESSQKCPTPRQRFVEAQRRIWRALTQVHSLGYYITHEADMRQTAEAFADAECVERNGEYKSCLTEAHSTCRASILKEVFGD